MKKICLLFFVFCFSSCISNQEIKSQNKIDDKISVLNQDDDSVNDKGIGAKIIDDIFFGDAKKNNDQQIYLQATSDQVFEPKKKIDVVKIKKPNQRCVGFKQIGMASWYGGKKFHFKKTSNGEFYKDNEMTAAHPTLPMSCLVKVTNLSNHRSVNVRINDRGPFSKDRIIDVSTAAASKLGFRNKGIAKVKIEFVKEDNKKSLKRLKALH